MNIEASLDGLDWFTVATGNHSIVSVTTSHENLVDLALYNACFNSVILQCPDGSNNFRQIIEFDIDAEGEEFRFLRVANPESIYTGLTGFLDRSELFLDVSPADPVPDPDLETDTTQTLSCEEDIMEKTLHSEDPCTFGGYFLEENDIHTPFVRFGNYPGQWDTPSFFHTYPLEGATLESIEGDVTVRDYRTNGPSEDQKILIQTSTNGEIWRTLHEFPVERVHNNALSDDYENALYEGSFSTTLDHEEADFLRLVAEPRPNVDEYWNPNTPWADRHPWAYFQHSEITLEGILPT